jgi:hypothetical protein
MEIAAGRREKSDSLPAGTKATRRNNYPENIFSSLLEARVQGQSPAKLSDVDYAAEWPSCVE